MIVKCSKCSAKNRVNESAVATSNPVCGICGAPLDVTQGVPEPAKGGAVRTVTDATFDKEVQSAGNVPYLVDAWAPWCGPCRMIAPALEQLAAESNGKYIIGKLNVDENQQTAAKFRIQSIPTMLIFKNGQLVDRLTGALPKQAIAAKLASHTQAAGAGMS